MAGHRAFSRVYIIPDLRLNSLKNRPKNGLFYAMWIPKEPVSINTVPKGLFYYKSIMTSINLK